MKCYIGELSLVDNGMFIFDVVMNSMVRLCCCSRLVDVMYSVFFCVGFFGYGLSLSVCVRFVDVLLFVYV